MEQGGTQQILSVEKYLKEGSPGVWLFLRKPNWFKILAIKFRKTEREMSPDNCVIQHCLQSNK